ncbi:MAG TPA: tetratricopeptide repeat protein [Nevskiaceae bacterium]|nr:tetratricopeptide repeat protein [Nevskiaceae bacterium]
MVGLNSAARGLGVALMAATTIAFAATAPSASTATPNASDPGAIKVDQSVQDIKDAAVVLDRDLLTLDETLLYPDITRVSVYIGVKVGGFMLSSMSVALDDGQLVTYNYTDSESRALLKGGLHRLLRVNMQPGAHRVHAEFAGKFIDAQPKDPPIKGAVDRVFDKNLGPLDLTVPITRNSRLDRPGLPEVQRMESTQTRIARRAVMLDSSRWADSHDYAPGSAADPRLGMAIFLKNDKRYYTAIAELLRIAATVPDPDQLPIAFHEQLAECYLNFGMPDRAIAIYKRLARESATNAVDAARARLRLGQFQLERGYVSDATETLSNLSEKLPADVMPEWQDLLSRALLAQGRNAQAVEVLNEGKFDNLSPYARYNLAIALLNEGRVEQGRTILDRLGTMKVTDVETLTLRDRANLTLGYHFLRSQQGGTAKPIFGRIRTEGPYSNRALLGLGWSELAPRGELQKHAPGSPEDQSPFSTFSSLGVLLRPGYYDADPFKRLGLRPFKLSNISKEEEEALKRALVPWTELVARDPMHPAVQEALLAIPFALDRLKAHEQALQEYQRAIDTLETTRKHMDDAMVSIKQGRMVETIVRRDSEAESGWQWRLRDLPDAPETYFLQNLLAENVFQETLKNYRDLRLIGRNLDGWKDRMAGFDRGAADQQQPNIAPELFIARARQTYSSIYVIMSLALRADDGLAAPGTYDAPLTFDVHPNVKLAAVYAPRNANGPFERMAAVRGAIDQLKPKLASASADGSKQLEATSLRELNGQKKQIERYLVEARLSVARIYDRESKEQPAAPRGDKK